MEKMKSLRYANVWLFLLTVGLSGAVVNPVGVWKAGVQHGKLSAADAANVKRIKAGVAGGSFKINKDKTFGLSLAGIVMMGTWSVKGDLLTIAVKEMVGKEARDVAKLPASQRTGQFRILKDGTMISLPDPGGNKPRIMWRQSK